VAEQVTVVWPPSGIALAALLVLGFRVWPGVWLGALAANLLAHEPVVTAAAIATGNTLEAVGGAWLLNRVGFHESLDRVWDVMGLLGLAAGLSATLAATVGATSLCVSGTQPASAFGALWFVWWLGDAMGILLFAPALLIWGRRPRLEFSRPRAAEAIALGVCVVSASVATFGGRFAQLTGNHLGYVVFPLLIWAALRFGPRGVSPAILVVTLFAVAFTVRGQGPFGATGASNRLVMLQMFLAVAALTALVLGAAIAERDAAERRRRANYAAARVMARSTTLEEAAPQILEAIGACLGWDVGALWTVAPRPRAGLSGDLAPSGARRARVRRPDPPAPPRRRRRPSRPRLGSGRAGLDLRRRPRSELPAGVGRGPRGAALRIRFSDLVRRRGVGGHGVLQPRDPPSR
jgi:integral membrane sensor domain MASE1